MPRSDSTHTARSERLVVLGASGGCGRWVVRLAAERGWRVTAVVRPGTMMAFPAGVEVRVGDPADVRLLDEVTSDATAVISAIGQRRAGRSPWARPLSPPDLVETVMSRLLPVMAWNGVKRLLAISAGGVGDSHGQLSGPVRRLVGLGQIAVAYRDLERMEELLQRSDRDWSVVRPVTLVDGAPTGRAGAAQRYEMWSMVRRGDVARVLVDGVVGWDAGWGRAMLVGCRCPGIALRNSCVVV